MTKRKKKTDKDVKIILFGLVLIFLSIFLYLVYESTTWEVCEECRGDVCDSWIEKKCEYDNSSDGVPDEICEAYNDLTRSSGDCNYTEVADACGCFE